MTKKKVAKIEFAKVATAISFATLAAIGGATGNIAFAGLAAIPAASLASYETLRDQLGWFKTQKEKTLEIPAPSWWTQDIRSWQNLCTEIEQHLPRIFQDMQAKMQQEQQVLTGEIVQKIFIDILVAVPLTWEYDTEQRRRVGEFLVPYILQKIEEVLKPIIGHLQQEGALLDTRKVVSHTEQTVHVLEKIHAKIVQSNGPLPLSKEENAILHERYCRALYNHWKMLDFKGIMHFDMNHPISIPLTDVFVFPDIQMGVPEYETLERDSEYFPFPNHPRQRARHVIRQREPFQGALIKHRRLVVLGDPGSGKSTLLRYLLLQLAQENDTFAATFPLLSQEATCVPLYMPLSAYAEIFLTNTPGTRSLEAFLPIYLRENYLGDYVDFLQGHIQNGNVVFLFDGLDEIPDAALRMRIVSHIEQFTQLHATNRFIVTSRIVGYKEAPLSASEYQVYTLADFSKEQVKIFTQRWCPAYERWVNGFSESQHLEDAATKEAEQLFNATQSKPAVKRLAVNPLLLTILALIQRQGIDLPSHRVELYRLCTETLIDTWVKAKGQSIQFSKNELIRILRPLAFWMHEHAAVGAIPQEELHEQIVRQLVERTLNEYEANQQAEQFLQIVRGKTGILVERGKERYGFLHLTFEEYFTAKAVELRKDRDIFIKRHLHDPRWREVIFLTVGAVGIIQNDEEKVTELVQTIVNAGSLYEWALHRDLFFAGHCLADDIGVLPTYEHEIIQRIILLYLTSPHDGLRTACSSILAAWSGTKVADKAGQLVLPILQQWVAAPEAKRMFFATSPFEKNVGEQLEQLTKQRLNEITNNLHFDLAIILASLQSLEQVDWKKSLLDILTSEEVKSRIVAIFEQGYGEHQSLITALIAALSDPHVNTRTKAITALGQLAPLQPEVSNALLSALSDDSLDVRREAATTLIQLGKVQPALIKPLLIAFENESLGKYQVIDIIGETGDRQPSVIDTLLLALTNRDDESLRNAAAKALAQISQGESYVIDALLSSFPDYDAYTMDAIIYSFGRIYKSHINIRSSILSELTAIADADADALQIIAKALGKLSSNPSYITNLLLSSYIDAQKAKEIAVKMLGYLGRGYPSVIDTLLNIVMDTNATLNVRREAIEALVYLEERQPRIIHALLSILSSTLSWSMRSAAASALGELGNNQPHVIDVLLQILSDECLDTRVRSAAASALGELGDNQPHVIDAFLAALSTSPQLLSARILKVLALKSQNEPRIIKTLLSTYQEQPRLINILLRASSSIDDPHTQTTVMDFFEQQSKNQPEMIDILLVALTDRNQFIQRDARNLLIHLGKIYPHITHDLIIARSRTDITQEATAEYKNHIFGIITSRSLDILRELNSDYPNIADMLFKMLHAENYNSVNRAAARMLMQLSNKRTDLLEKLFGTFPHMNVRTRIALADAFWWDGKQVQQSTIDILFLLLSDEFAHIRKTAIRALEQVDKGQTRVIESLLSALFDADGSVRSAAARSLGLLGKDYPQVIDALLQALSDNSGSVRQSAAIALGALGENQNRIIEALTQTLFGSSSLGREGACSALGQLGRGQPQVIEALLSALSSPDYKIRIVAARTLRLLDENQPHIINTLLPLLSDPDWLVRSEAVEALGDLHKEQIDTVDALIPLLADSSNTVRATTARAFRTILRENEDTRVTAALQQATYDSNRAVREAAMSALAFAQSDVASIGTRIEDLLRQCEYGIGSSTLLFNALRAIADKKAFSNRQVK